MIVTNETTEFAYSKYKLIAECDALNNDNLIANYTWQVNPQDVPVMATINGTTALYIPDGNKNIVKLLSLNGEVLAEYRYSPFGKVVSSAGLLAEANPFRFSSEYHDDETNLVYYNYRYYSPALGRWLSRDPIEEQGGYNLYAMVKNNVINWLDILGLNLDCSQLKKAVQTALKNRIHYQNTERELALEMLKLNNSQQWNARFSLAFTVIGGVKDIFKSTIAAKAAGVAASKQTVALVVARNGISSLEILSIAERARRGANASSAVYKATAINAIMNEFAPKVIPRAFGDNVLKDAVLGGNNTYKMLEEMRQQQALEADYALLTYNILKKYYDECCR